MIAPADDASHILVVDDDRRIRDLLSRYLAQQGYRVTTAASASEARAKLRGLDFDLLVLDVGLPDGSGLDLCKALRQHWPRPTSATGNWTACCADMSPPSWRRAGPRGFGAIASSPRPSRRRVKLWSSTWMETA